MLFKAQGSKRRLTVALAAAGVALGVAAPGADAGIYSVYSCKTPTGAGAPTDGWTAEQVGGSFSNPVNSCMSGGSLMAQLNGDHAQPVGSRITWRFAAPPNTKLWNFWVWRSASSTTGADTNATPLEFTSWPTASHTDARDACVGAFGCLGLGSHGSWNAPGNFYDAGAPDGISDVFFTAACGGTAGWSCADRNSATPMSDMRVHAFRAYLQDDTDPVPAGIVSGTLTQPGPHKGSRSVSFNATDTGSGIYRGIVDVRRAGQTTFAPVYSAVLDSNGGRCADAGANPSDDHEFLYRVPCKLSTGGSVDLDTTTVPDGTHELRVRVEDASGNRSIVYGPVAFEVDNVPPPAPVDPDGDGPADGRPSIAGAAKVGNTLVGERGTWSGSGISYATAWLRCVSAADEGTCTTIPGATGSQLELTNADLGYFIRYRVTATNAEGETTVASAPAGPVRTAAGELPHCADGIDNDGDGKVDDADAGCSERGDGSENSDGPACSNGKDDDGDGKVDGDDPGCSGAGDTSEESQSGGDRASGGIIVPGGEAPSPPAPALGTPNNGVNASNRAQITITGTRRRKVKFGRRIATVVTLRDENGRPIAGARVSVLERMSVPSANWMPARESLVTDGDGKMRWLIPAKFGRTIRYAYKANLANADFQSTADVVLNVGSKTTVKSNRSFFRNGETIRFSGHVKSRPVPVAGVLIDLQARVGKRWQTFETTRTRSTGKWATKYTFRATRGLQTYTFRARVRKDTGFPYAMSRSRILKVRVAG